MVVCICIFMVVTVTPYWSNISFGPIVFTSNTNHTRVSVTNLTKRHRNFQFEISGISAQKSTSECIKINSGTLSYFEIPFRTKIKPNFNLRGGGLYFAKVTHTSIIFFIWYGKWILFFGNLYFSFIEVKSKLCCLQIIFKMLTKFEQKNG